ncbi:hypothetical protein BDF19DRAFT_438722 [Syncephalis fuscata]|nr:hypothetical protein BDF19DRAFT_438722 [Syncephalis fuscata]
MSARDILHDHWKDPRTLTALDEFFVDVARYQSRSLRLPKESSWRPPVKYRVSDLKKEQWLLDLSNLSIPLHTLAHSIPTGLKGEKLLEALSNRQPPLVRAVWSIKVTSLAELMYLLGIGSTFTLSLELKNILAQFLEAQLAELAGGPRSASTPSMGYMTGRMESRQRWTSRWWYSTKLAESLHNEGLVEQRYFLKWLLDRLATSGLEQTVVLLPLVTALLEDIVRSRALSRLLIDTLLSKLQTVFRLTGLDGKSRRFQHVIDEITVTLQVDICIQWPDALVQPKAWHRYDTTLKQLLAIDSVAITATDQITRNLAFTVIIKEPELSTIKSLDGLLQPTLREVTTQKWINQARQQFTTSVEQLCRWAICTENNEDRIYIAPALLAKLRQIMSKSIQVELQSILIDFLEQSTEDIQRLVRFYDQLIQRNVFSYTRYLRRLVARGTLQNMVSESFSQHMNSAVANQRRILLYGVNVTLNPEDEMVDVLVTRLSSKLPYLTATESTAVDNVSLAASSLTIDHTALPTPPSLSMSGSSGNGIGAQESDIGHRRVIQSVSTMTEPLVDDATLDDELQLGFDEDTLGLLKESSRYCQTRITRHWLMPLVKQYVVKEVQIGIDNWRVITSPGSSLLNARQLATIIMIMELVNDSQTLIELVLWVLDHTEDQTMGLICIDTLLRHETCWMALDWQEKVFETVTLKYARLSSKGGDFVVLNGLKRLISHGYGTIEQVKARLTDPGFTLIMTSTPSGLPSLSATTQLPQLTTPNPSSISHGHSSMTGPSATSATPSGLIQLPDRLDDMRFQPLVLDTRQITTLAQSIWFKYHAEPNWFARLLESLNLQVFANLINHLIRGDITLRNVLQQWMTDRLNTDEQKMASTAHRNWRLILMLMLISRDCYDIIYGLENVILPLLIGAIGNEQQQTWDRTCIADLLSWLAAALLQVSVSSSSSSSSSPSQFLQLSTKDALSLETRISTSIEHLDQCKPIISLLIPLIQLEIALPLSDALRHQCHWLRCQLLKTKWFKRISLKDSVAFARHLVAQRPLVSLPPTTDTFNIVLHSGLVMLGASESDNSPSDTSYLEAFSYALCHLSPWNISSNQAIIHLTLTGLGYDMYDKKVSSSLEEEKATTMEMGDSTTMNIDNPPNNDQSIACAFFDAVVLQSNTDLQLLFEIVSSLPACVLRLLIDHGQQLLDASMSQFPVNVLVFPGLANCPATLAASLKRLYTIMLLLLARADKFKEEMDKSLENMACSLLAQLQRFVDHSKVLAIMTSKALDFSEASKHIEQDQPNDKTTLDQLRLCMELRLRLVVPLLERLLEQPQACATGNWIITLLELLTSSLMADTSYFDNSNSKDISVQQSSIFEFSLDLLSFLLDEIPKDVRTHVLETMRVSIFTFK